MKFRHDPTPGRLVKRHGEWIEVRPLPNGGESRLYIAHAHRCIEAIHMRHADEALATPPIVVQPKDSVIGRIRRRA